MEHTLPRKRLGFTVWISASDRHTCPTSLAARRQKRAEILRLETVPGSSKKPALMVIAMLLLQPLPVPAAPLQSLCPYSPPLTFWASLSCFTLTTPAHTHPSSLPRPVSYFLLSLSVHSLSLSFSQTLMALFLHQATFPSVSTIPCPCPLSQQMGQGEQDTCSDLLPSSLLCTTARVPPPASLQHSGQG